MGFAKKGCRVQWRFLSPLQFDPVDSFDKRRYMSMQEASEWSEP
jgi:hypothetical protein